MDQEEQNRWLELLHGQVIDPVMTLMVCYECVRRGHEATKKLMVSEVIPNLEKYFPDIPDTAAVAELLGLSRLLPSSPPLFTEGLLAFPDWEDSLPYPAGKHISVRLEPWICEEFQGKIGLRKCEMLLDRGRCHVAGGLLDAGNACWSANQYF